MAGKQRVLFLCSGNSARSQMAEAILRNLAGDRFDVFSAGLEPKPVHPLAVEAMKEIGIDISRQRSKSVTEFLGQDRMNYIITVCDRVAATCPAVWPGLAKMLHWSFEDPAAFEGKKDEKLAKFREIRDQIRGQIASWIESVVF